MKAKGDDGMQTDIGGRGAQRLTDTELTAFYEKYSPAVFRLCMSYLKDVHDSADAVQETFLRLLSSGGAFRDSQHEIGWLVMTAGNICKDMLRKRRRHPSEELEAARGIGAEERAYSDTELFDAVCSLPHKYKNVIFLFYYEDMTTAEISAATGMKQSTVTSLLTRARRLLKKALGDDLNG
ncbi:MAG: sigma-70 family RNA polymerase sigma factor [Ruminococcus sp.]|nr:sigma-70 family RNA polymerase sigma factor [Ruminococcus sp.]